MAKRRRDPYSPEELAGPAPAQPSLLKQAGGGVVSGLSAVGNLLDLPGSMVRDTIGGVSTGNWSKYNPLDQVLTPFRDINRTTGRDLNRMGGLAGSKDTYGNWWGGLGTEIATDPLTYLTGGLTAAAKTGFGKVAGKAGIHGLEAARIGTAASKAGKLSGLGKWMGPREANLLVTGRHIKEFAPEMFDTLTSVAKNQKGSPYDLLNNMDTPLGALGQFWPAGEAGLFGTGKTAQRIARGLDVAGDTFRHFKIPGTNLRPVAGLTNLVNKKAGGAVTPEDLQTAYHTFHAKEGARYEHRLLTAKWTHDLERMGHKATDAVTVRDWFEFPNHAPSEVRPLVDEVRKYIDRIPQIAGEMGVKIGDVTPKMRAAGSQADYYMRFIAEGLAGNKNARSFGKLFDPHAAAEFNRLEWTHGSRAGTKGLVEMFQDPVARTLAKSAKNPKSLERWIGRKYGIKLDAAGKEIGGNLPPEFLDSKQITAMKEMGIDPTVGNAHDLITQLRGTKPEDFIKFRDVLKAKGNLDHREAAAIANIWKAYAEGYHGEGLGATFRKIFKGQGFHFNRKPGQYGQTLFQESEHAPAFYSKLFDESLGLKGKIGWDQLKATLKNKGVKDEEVLDSGLEAFMAGKKSVAAEDIQQYLHDNAIELKEVMKGGADPEKLKRYDDLYARRQAYMNDIDAPDLTTEELYEMTRLGKELNDRVGQTKFDRWKTPGGQNYREMLMQMGGRQDTKALELERGELRAKLDKMARNPEGVSGHIIIGPNGIISGRHGRNQSPGWVVKYGDEVSQPFDTFEAANKATMDGTIGPARPDKAALYQRFDEVGELLKKAKDSSYQSSHWDEPNVLAHVRFQDHTDASGKKVLLIDEIQSDWHQAGRKKGYQDKNLKQRNFASYIEEKYGKDAAQEMIHDKWEAGRSDPDFAAWRDEQDIADQQWQKAPDAPFKKSWHTLAMKRMIRWAAENGYDRVAWTKGIDQVDRYPAEMRKVADHIFWGRKGYSQRLEVGIRKSGNDIANLVLDNNGVVKESHGLPGAEGKALEEVIGKPMAQKVLTEPLGEIEGKDFTIGGKGMEGFYDEILPNETNKLIKKHGSRVGETRINTAGEWQDLEFSDMGSGLGQPQVGKSFHSFDITPQMRKEVLEKGQPLYQKANLGGIKGATEFGADGKAIIHSYHNTDVSTHLHEMAHVMRRHLTAEDQRIADAFVGATGTWTRQQEELFSRGFERYMREGLAPNKAIEGLFERLKKWMVKIYQSISGSQIDVQLTPEIQELYGRLVGGGPKGGAARAEQFRPKNTFRAAAETMQGMSPELLESGVYANHPINDFAAAMSGTMDKLHASKIALERMAEAAVPEGQGTVPIPVVLKNLDLEFGDGTTKGAIKWLKDHGIADPEKAHLSPETASFLTQMGHGWRGGPKEVHAAVEAWDNFSNVMKAIFTNLDPIRFNVRNRMSGLFANWLGGLVGIMDGSSRDAQSLMKNMVIQGASQNPHLQQMAAERGIQGLDDKRATEMLAEIMYAVEATGSYGVAQIGHTGDALGGRLDDIKQAIPGGHPFSWADVGNKAIGGFGTAGTTLNPISSWRGVGGAEKSKFAPLAAGEDISHLTESLNRMAPVWAQIQDGAHPVEAARRAMEAQVDYRSRNYTEFEQQVLKRIFLFYSFSKGMFPFSVNQLINNPGGKLAQTLRLLNRGKGEDDLVPQHVAETASIPIGHIPGMQSLEPGAKRYITGLGMGFEDPAQFAVPSFQNAGLEAISRMNPVLKAPLESLFGQSTFQRGPGGGGRSLEDLDPALGRTLSNIRELATGDKSKNPVRYPGSSVIEHALSNSPLSGVINKLRTATDPRKGLGAKAINLLTGIKATDVSPSAQDRELRNRVGQIEKQLGGRTFSLSYVPKETQEGMSPKEKKALEQLKAIKDLLEARSKSRKAPLK